MGGIGVIVLGAVAVGGYAVFSSRPHVAVVSNAQRCVNQPTKLASLFSDGETTMIRLSNRDLSSMQVLRTEPANVLPGMFDALLSLSGDNTHLAYVTASDELMDDAHIKSISVTDPSTPTELAAIPKGFWVVRPAWSPDNKKLAFVKLDESADAASQFQLWLADMTTQPATVSMQSDLVADNFTNGRSSEICWTADNRVVLVPSSPLTLASPSPSAAATGMAPASPSTGSQCGVPIFSQNDPAWRDVVMKSDADSIGGAGCALTSTAMLLNYYGSSLTPAQLNSCLAGNADPIDWKAVPGCTNGLISGGDRIDFTWPDLDLLLAAGRPAIVGMIRGKTGSHFVVVTQGGGGVADTYRITDPWDATTFKTLGSYINDGYNPTWIISFTGPGHNCGRLIKGVVPAIPSLQDGGSTTNPVTLNISPNLKNLKYLGIQKLSSGAIQKDTFNLPLPFTKITSGTTVNDEGIYEVLVTTQAPSQPPRFQLYRFTIDRTPPVVDLTLLNPKTSGNAARSMGRDQASMPAAAISYPLVNRPGKVQVLSSDTLSGIKEIKYSLDGNALAEYSSDNTFNRVLSVDGCGDHSFRIQGFDAAGNVQDVTKNFTVYCYVPPSPTPPPPPPPPPRCTSTLGGGSVSATRTTVTNRSYAVSWSSSGGCGPFRGTITAAVCGPDATGKITCQAPYKAYTITTQSGGPIADTAACPPVVPGALYYVQYTLSLRDAFGQTTGAAFGNPNATPDPPC